MTSRVSGWRGYVVALGIVGLAFGARLVLLNFFGPAYSYLPYFPAVMLSALVGGLGPGLVALILSFGLATLWLPPMGAPQPNAFVTAVLFCTVNLLCVVACELMHRARAAAFAAESKTDETIRQSEQQMRLITDALPALIAYVDRDGRYTFNNRTYDTWFAMSRDKIRGQRMEDILGPAYDVLRPHVDAALAGKQEHFEHTLTMPDGITREVAVTYSPDLAADGTVNGFAILVFDLTERQQLLASERRARAEAEHLNRLKDEFLATLSHELRTPLNAIVGWTQIIQRDSQPATVSEGLAVIERNAVLQTRLIEDLLDMSRIISGKVRLEMQRVEPRAIVETAIASILPAAQAKSIALRKTLENNLPSISGDPARLQQVVWNLLTNAIKFTPTGGTVTVALVRTETHMHMTVTDTGDGIDAKFLPFVFDRFRQADATTTRSVGGLGLGLAIAKNLIEMHGGAVTAQSDGLGKGSTFIVALPLRPTDAVAATKTPAPPTSEFVPAMNGSPPQPRLAGVRVLVVDDEADARQVVQRLLTASGAIVETAGSAQEGLDAVRRQPPAVILSDIAMPKQDGYEFLRLLRAGGVTTPAVALTAFARTEDRVRAIHAGYQVHLPKPVVPEELVAVVASLSGRLEPLSNAG